jgi:hypothetical protein
VVDEVHAVAKVGKACHGLDQEKHRQR